MAILRTAASTLVVLVGIGALSYLSPTVPGRVSSGRQEQDVWCAGTGSYVSNAVLKGDTTDAVLNEPELDCRSAGQRGTGKGLCLIVLSLLAIGLPRSPRRAT